MTSAELKEIVEQRANDSAVLGRLACNLRSDEPVEQHQADGVPLTVHWQDLGGYWRCAITRGDGPDYVARVDVHDNSTVRIEAREACSVTISPDDDLLCLTRFR